MGNAQNATNRTTTLAPATISPITAAIRYLAARSAMLMGPSALPARLASIWPLKLHVSAVMPVPMPSLTVPNALRQEVRVRNVLQATSCSREPALAAPR